MVFTLPDDCRLRVAGDVVAFPRVEALSFIEPSLRIKALASELSERFEARTAIGLALAPILPVALVSNNEVADIEPAL